MTNIHYFYDPMCGWCYGATSLIKAIAEHPSMNLILHPGGMMEKSTLPQHFKEHIIKADPRIAALTGVKFGENYLNRLRSSEEFIIDSFLPIKVILVAESMGGNGFEVLKAIQHAHYVQGLEVYKLEVLQRIVAESGIDQEKWLASMSSESSDDLLEQAIATSHGLMRKLNISGYPTLIAESNGALVKLPHEQYYNKANEWKTFLTSL